MFKFSSKVRIEIQRIQGQFIWGWGHSNMKISWIKWRDMCKSKEEGWLGIRDIHLI